MDSDKASFFSFELLPQLFYNFDICFSAGFGNLKSSIVTPSIFHPVAKVVITVVSFYIANFSIILVSLRLSDTVWEVLV